MDAARPMGFAVELLRAHSVEAWCTSTAMRLPPAASKATDIGSTSCALVNNTTRSRGTPREASADATRRCASVALPAAWRASFQA